MQLPANKQAVQTAFDKAAQGYAEHCHVQLKSALALLTLLRQQQTDFQHIIDLGCGCGTITERLIECIHFQRCTAVDFSENMLRLCQQKLANNQFDYLLADFDQINLPNASADLIFSNMSLQWSFDYQKTFAELQRLCSAQGYLALAIPNQLCFSDIKQAARHTLQRNLFNDFPSVRQIEGYLRDFTIISHQQLRYIDFFKSSLDLLRSFKKTGAAANKQDYQYPLTKSMIKQLDHYFLDQKKQRYIPLDYVISLLIAKRRSV